MTNKEDFTHINCEKCNMGGLLNDTISKYENTFLCIWCIEQIKKVLQVFTFKEASIKFKESTGKELDDYETCYQSQLYILIDFMKEQGFSYNSMNNTFEKSVDSTAIGSVKVTEQAHENYNNKMDEHNIYLDLDQNEIPHEE